MSENETPEGETPDLAAQLEAALKEAEKWKSLSRQNEDRAKSNADKAKRLDEIEEANKTEVQRLTEQLEKATKTLAERDAADERKKLVSEIAEAHKVDARALRGSTREELEEHAEILKSMIPEPPAAPSADGQGASGDPIGGGDMSAAEIVSEATK